MQLDRFITRNGKLYRIDAAGSVYAWENYPGRSGLGELDGFWKKLTRGVSRAVKRAIKAPIKLHKAVFKGVTKSKFGRQALRVGGAIFAPFTGGLSLAAAEAASRYGKARYVLGLSRGQAFRRGAVGAAIGYVGGKGIQYGYSALTKPAASAAFAPVGAPAAVPGGFSYGSYTGAAGASTAAGTSAATTAGTGLTLKTIGTTFATGLKTLTGALPLLQASGVLGPRGEQAPSGEFYDSGAPAPAPFESMYGSPRAGGGGPSGGALPYGQEGEEETAPDSTSQKQFAIGGAVALAGLLFFTTMKPKRGRR